MRRAGVGNALLLAVLLGAGACAGGGSAGPGDRPSPDARGEEGAREETVSVTLAALDLAPHTGAGDYLLGSHPTQTTGLLAAEELRIEPGGRIQELLLRVALPSNRRVGATDAGLEVFVPRFRKVIFRFNPPGGSDEVRNFTVQVNGAREVVLRPMAASRDLIVVKGSSRVDYIPEPPDTTAQASARTPS